jgi:hypothetical protein
VEPEMEVGREGGAAEIETLSLSQLEDQEERP